MTAALSPLALLMAAYSTPIVEPVDLSLRVKENDAFLYQVNVDVQSDMGALKVTFTDSWKIGKGSDQGILGSRSWLSTQIDLEGQIMDSDDEKIEFNFGKDGLFSNVTGDTEGMLIRLHPFFMFYGADKPMEVGGTWDRTISMKLGVQETKVSCKGKLLGIKEVSGSKFAEVEIVNEEFGSAPISAKGILLISMSTGMPQEGKFEFKNVRNAEMVMDGVMTFKAKSQK